MTFYVQERKKQQSRTQQHLSSFHLSSILVGLQLFPSLGEGFIAMSRFSENKLAKFATANSISPLLYLFPVSGMNSKRSEPDTESILSRRE